VPLSRRRFLGQATGTILLGGLAACGSKEVAKRASVPSTVKRKPLVKLVDRVKIGCYVNESGYEANPVPPHVLDSFEQELGRRFDIIHYFFPWEAPFSDAINSNVPERQLMISWNPTGPVIPKILTSAYDAYIADYGRAAKAYRHPVYIRLAAEMNGDWNSYSAGSAGGPSAKDFILAWHRVVGIFRAVHADNVKFIWCPTEIDTPDVAGNHLENYWPGAKYVDLLGFDAYNWSVGGDIEGGGGWRPFDTMCATGYQRVAALDKSLPIWLCETGCTEAVPGDPPGVSKGAWFTDMFQSTLYPRLKGLVYFSSDDTTLGRNWRIDTSSEAIEGWKKGWT
jgi:Glycosyl hydrolase family 26